MGDLSRMERSHKFMTSFKEALEKFITALTCNDDDFIVRIDGKVLFDPGAFEAYDITESVALTLGLTLKEVKTTFANANLFDPEDLGIEILSVDDVVYTICDLMAELETPSLVDYYVFVFSEEPTSTDPDVLYQRIRSSFEDAEGDFIASCYNKIASDQMVYQGDSLFWAFTTEELKKLNKKTESW